MIYLGADPGVARLGWGVVEAVGSRRLHLGHGCLSTMSGAPHEIRLLHLFEAVRSLLAKFRPDFVAVEEVFFRKNVRTAISVAEARGAILIAAAEAGAKVRPITPSAVKQGIAGWGGADKGQVQRMIQMLLGLPEPPRPDDAADALAVAYVASLWGVAPGRLPTAASI